jgi:hypothetical protein
MSYLICNCFGCEPVSPGLILPFCRYRAVQADAGLPAWSSLPTELEYHAFFQLFFIITQRKQTYKVFCLLSSTSYADPGLKIGEHLCFCYCKYLTYKQYKLQCLRKCPRRRVTEKSQLFHTNGVDSLAEFAC